MTKKKTAVKEEAPKTVQVEFLADHACCDKGTTKTMETGAAQVLADAGKVKIL